VLCERGIRTYEPATRFTLDLSAVAYVKTRTHLPVVVDPSHSTGIKDLVAPMALAAAAAGADGLLVDVHPDASTAKCDGPQALNIGEHAVMMAALRRVVAAVGRTLSTAPLPPATATAIATAGPARAGATPVGAGARGRA
jgi:3-deoxy-7-phosphoheptulonate synthase